MVNLSPTEESFYESLCSLRLAKQVNQCELGKPKKQLKEVKELPPLKDASQPSSISTPSRGAGAVLSASMSNLSSVMTASSAGPLSASMGSSRKTPNPSINAGNAAKKINIAKK